MYRTSDKNIQILLKVNFYNFSDLRYNEFMGILDNLESAWDEEFQFEHTNLAVKMFSETCCNGCSCQSSTDHDK